MSTEPAARGAIVLAAFRPDPELFRIQLESIRDQTLHDWVCLIGADGGQEGVRRLVAETVGSDSRFQVVGWEENVGFYLNFERLLASVPDTAGWVALSDQDDRWYPDKLERLVPMLEHRALATGQARVITWPELTVLHPKTERRQVPPRDLVMMNQVTGAFSVLRRDLLDVALPFPRLDTVTQLHDHWLAVCAAASAGYAVLDETVMDYHQHGGNVVGQAHRGLGAARAQWEGLVRECDRTLGHHRLGALLGRSEVLAFGWRRMMVDTLRVRVGRARLEDLGIASMGSEGVRADAVRNTVRALTSPRVSAMTALTFLAGLPCELLIQRPPPPMPTPAPRIRALSDQSLHDSGARRRIAVALVLYEVSPTVSEALQTFLQEVDDDADRFDLFVYDNSHRPGLDQDDPGKGISSYTWDPLNPGLARHYQDALERAERGGHGWLMLLDQDTRVTAEYLREVLATVDALPHGSDVVTIAPRLEGRGGQLSPHRQVFIRTRPILRSGKYTADARCEVWNSGRLLSVSAVRAAGGFPFDYPLDYLDHALSARLRALGGATAVIDAALPHSFSMLNRTAMPRSRQRSIAMAEERYFTEYGSLLDRAFLVCRRSLVLVLVLGRRIGSPSRREDMASLGRSISVLLRGACPTTRSPLP